MSTDSNKTIVPEAVDLKVGDRVRCLFDYLETGTIIKMERKHEGKTDALGVVQFFASVLPPWYTVELDKPNGCILYACGFPSSFEKIV